ncbi:MAG: cadherin repeat domain-containing protein [Candidatus Thioglobus sp.]
MSLYINDIVTSTLPKIGASGSRNVTSSWNTSSNTAYVKVGSTYFNGYYLSNVKIDISFDNNGYLDRYSMSGSADGAGYSESGLHNLSYSQRNSVEAAYDQIEAREWAEEQALVEAAETQKSLEAAEALITQTKDELRNTFDAETYLAKYSDVKEAYGSDAELALDHYVRNGKNEGRSYLNTRPTAITLDNSSVPENSSGSHIGNLSGIDSENDALTFNIVGGSDASMFEVVNNMLHLSTNATADYETKSNLYVELSTTDIGGLSYNQSFTIFVTNTDESQLISYGGLGRDTFSGFSGYKTINGKEGIDIVQYSYSSNGITFSVGVDGELLVMSADDKRESLLLIERLQFTDKVYALDIDSNAEIAAKVIISAFGAENLSSYMFSILSVVDNGKAIESLSDYVIDSGLIDSVIGSATNGSFVEHVFENVVGRLPNLVEQTIYTDYLDNGTYTKSSLLALAANTTLTENLVTANSVDLIGVAGSADGELLAIQYDLGLG